MQKLVFAVHESEDGTLWVEWGDDLRDSFDTHSLNENGQITDKVFALLDGINKEINEALELSDELSAANTR